MWPPGRKLPIKVLEILAQHIPEGQVGVFLAALYQLMCTQQQGITSMVVTQAGVPVHLGVHSSATQASMTWLFAQVIPGLGSLRWVQLWLPLPGAPKCHTQCSSDGRSPVHAYTSGRENMMVPWSGYFPESWPGGMAQLTIPFT